MKKIIVAVVFGCLFLTSCGPKRMGCGPYRRCEVKMPTKMNSDTTKSKLS